MKIKEINGEKWLTVCAWQQDEFCEDYGITKEDLEKIKVQENIHAITHGICSKCEALIQLLEPIKDLFKK